MDTGMSEVLTAEGKFVDFFEKLLVFIQFFPQMAAFGQSIFKKNVSEIGKMHSFVPRGLLFLTRWPQRGSPNFLSLGSGVL